MPTGILELRKRMFAPPPEFAGVFETFEEALSSINGQQIWEGEHWRSKQTRKICGFNETFESYNNNSLVHSSPLGISSGPLMLLMNAMSLQKQPVKVLDFGGGTGLLYHAAMVNAIKPHNVEWFVCDNASLAELGQEKIRSNFSNIHYLETFEGLDYHILVISSTLHYIEDFKELLRSLLQCAPSVVCLERLHAGPIAKSYVSLQRQQELQTPILNPKLSDISTLFFDAGYHLVYKANNDNEIYGDASFSEEIPEELRIAYSVNLTFVRSPLRVSVTD